MIEVETSDLLIMVSKKRIPYINSHALSVTSLKWTLDQPQLSIWGAVKKVAKEKGGKGSPITIT